MNQKITIVGAGSFGSAIGQIMTDNGYEVLYYTNSKEQMKEINEGGTNQYYFEDLRFANTVRATTSMAEAMAFSNYVVMALPSDIFRVVLHQLNLEIKEPKIFISVSKGMENQTNKLLSTIIEEEIDQLEGVVVLSGPSHAEELVERHFTAITASSKSMDLACAVQDMFSNQYLRVYTVDDVLGVQLCACVKNILAIASGIVYGMGYGDNTRAALITRGLNEMIRYGKFKGAQISTFFGLAGLGDLIVTATSYHSRNFQTGLRIGKGMSGTEAIRASKTVVEGAKATKVVYEDIKNHNIEMPITEAVYKVLYEDAKPEKIMETIIKRDLKYECIG